MIPEELEIYGIALELSRLAWETYISLQKEHRYTLGKQFLEATDSIGANIAEGYGRYDYKDSLKFYYNARGSLYETKHWTYLLTNRSLINTQINEQINILIEKEQIKLKNFINSIKTKL